MNRKRYFLVTAIVFSVIGLLHLLRIVLGWRTSSGAGAFPCGSAGCHNRDRGARVPQVHTWLEGMLTDDRRGVRPLGNMPIHT
jgi:hypothetical protein